MPIVTRTVLKTYFEDGKEPDYNKYVDLIDTMALSGDIVTDHGALDGKADDDHPQYLLADGTRNLTGDLNVTDDIIVTDDVSLGGGLSVGDNSPVRSVPQGVLILDSTPSHYGFISSATNGLYLGRNAYYDGTTWRAWTDGKAGYLVVGAGDFIITGLWDDTVRTGGNAITPINKFHVDKEGLIRTLSGIVAGDLSSSPSLGEIYATDSVLSNGQVRAEGNASPSLRSGNGIELSMESTRGRLIAYNRTSSVDLPLELRGSGIYLNEAGTDVLTIDGGDVYTQGFQTYTPTCSGWSSYTNRRGWYKTIGDTVHYWWYVNGTSDAETTTIGVPFTSINSTGYYVQNICRAQNSGVWSNYPGLVSLSPNGSVLNCYLTNQQTPFTASGAKALLGYICYQRA